MAAIPQEPDTIFQAGDAWHTHSYLNSYIQFGDQKAGAIIAWTSALIAMGISSGLHKLVTRTHFTFEFWWTTTTLAVLATFAFALLVTGFSFAVFAIVPNLPTENGSGLIFWNHIRQRTRDEFTEHYLSTNSSQFNAELAAHIYDLAGVCSRKYRLVTCAIWLAATGSALFAVVVLLESAWR